jgi:protoporphyrinogen oxidase
MSPPLKFLILGAGPSGLSFAHGLLRRGERSFLVLEKEEVAGGLCRSAMVDGAPLDIGGGHFLDVKRREVLDLVFQFMPESEWTLHNRRARIRLAGTEVEHPLEGNLWQLPLETQVDFLESIARAGCVSDTPSPELFEDWIRWKLGTRIADDYMIPYNRKIWSMDLNRLGTYWLHKLPDVSLRDTLASCLYRQPMGSLPAHGQFLYPKAHGYGEVWRRMGEALGERLLTSTPITRIDLATRTVNETFQAETIVNTTPWPLWRNFATLPPEIDAAIAGLVQVPIDVDYVPEDPGSDAHWLYEPNESISYHRILGRTNFCPDSRGYWTETNAVRSAATPRHFRHHNPFAYPVNTSDKPLLVARIEQWARAASILPLGRWGTWEHMNSDVAVSLGLKAAATVPI